MKKILSLIAIFLFSTIAIAQQNEKGLTFKLYNQSSIIKTKNDYVNNGVTFYRYQHQKQFLSPKFAIAYTTDKGSMHELELNSFDLTLNELEDRDSDTSSYTIVDGAETNSMNLSFRYEYTAAKKTSKLNKKSNFSVSYGAQPFLYAKKTSPKISTNFPESSLMIGALWYIAPRYSYQFSDHLSLDINIPFQLIETSYTAISIDNPLSAERTKSTINFSMLPMNYQLRVGLAYKI